jgi:hypothetical protein
LVERDGLIYLFGNRADLGTSVLLLWSSPSLGQPFVVHPASPIRIAPGGSRMGGAIAERGGRLIRFGQDYTRGYGEGLIAFEITELGPATYAERPLGHIRFSGRKGPHTLNFREGEMVFDWYFDRFSLRAGVRRLALRWRHRALDER